MTREALQYMLYLVQSVRAVDLDLSNSVYDCVLDGD